MASCGSIIDFYYNYKKDQYEFTWEKSDLSSYETFLRFVVNCETYDSSGKQLNSITCTTRNNCNDYEVISKASVSGAVKVKFTPTLHYNSANGTEKTITGTVVTRTLPTIESFSQSSEPSISLTSSGTTVTATIRGNSMGSGPTAYTVYYYYTIGSNTTKYDINTSGISKNAEVLYSFTGSYGTTYVVHAYVYNEQWDMNHSDEAIQYITLTAPQTVSPTAPTINPYTRSNDNVVYCKITANNMGANPTGTYMQVQVSKTSFNAGGSAFDSQTYSYVSEGDEETFLVDGTYGTTYYFRARAYSSSSTSAWSSEKSVTLSSVKADTPSISAQKVGVNGQIDFSFYFSSSPNLGDPTADAFEYYIYDTAYPGTPVESESEVEFGTSSTKLVTISYFGSAGHSYYCKVRAYHIDAGDSYTSWATSSTISISTTDPDKLDAPTVTSTTSKSITATATLKGKGALPTANGIRFKLSSSGTDTASDRYYLATANSSGVATVTWSSLLDGGQYTVSAVPVYISGGSIGSSYNTAWSDTSTKISFTTVRPSAPNPPVATIEGSEITFTVTPPVATTSAPNPLGLYPTANAMKLEIYYKVDGNFVLYKEVVLGISGTQVHKFTGASGVEYKARVMCFYSGTTPVDQTANSWSSYSSSASVSPMPPVNINHTLTHTADGNYVTITWETTGATPDSYTLVYRKGNANFDTDTSGNTTLTITGVKTAVINNLETNTYYLRMRSSLNGIASEDYSEVYNFTVGSAPSAPSTYSAYYSVVIGEINKLTWIHNCKDEDGDDATAMLEWYYVRSGVSSSKTTVTFLEGINSYNFNTDKPAGITLQNNDCIYWRVKTKCFKESDWSGWKAFSVYSKPDLMVSLSATVDSEGNITKYPFTVGLSISSAQTVIAYSIKLKALQEYKESRTDGTTYTVSAGDIVFEKEFSGSDIVDNSCEMVFTPASVNIESGSYELITSAVTDVGISCDDTRTITTKFSDSELAMSVQMEFNPNKYSMNITAEVYTKKESGDYTREGDLAPHCTYSVYRKEYSGDLVLIQSEIDNFVITWVTDPHTSLKIPEYRIIATDSESGVMVYGDFSMEIDKASGIVINWNDSDVLELKYNIKIQSSFAPECETVNYAGRKYPVSYLGSKTEDTAIWDCAILRSDYNALSKIRQLANYFGDVYVREPSGIGYWANAVVSTSQSYENGIVDVSFKLTRVEGGI